MANDQAQLNWQHKTLFTQNNRQLYIMDGIYTITSHQQNTHKPEISESNG